MAAPKRPGADARRKSSTLHYHTFPTKPPKNRGRPPSPSREATASGSEASHNESTSSGQAQETPLPTKQLAILAVIALAEQTALNSISPYLPEMASTFPEVSKAEVGLFVGLIASAFALAQFTTNFFWGWLSDRIGRKPVVLTGTLLTAACFVAFGFCRTLWQAIIVQIVMGLVNGNQGVVATCLGEITDRSNQSKAFTYLPVVYGIGAITGPAVGGLLVFQENPFKKGSPNPYPYLLPNLFSGLILLVDFFLTLAFLDESLEEARSLPPLHTRVKNLFSWIWQFTGSSTRPTYTRNSSRRSSKGSASRQGMNGILPKVSGKILEKKHVFNRDTVLILITYFIFQLSNVAYNSLYPIFAEAEPPTGRSLSTEEVGLSMAFAGLITILFQVGIYERIMDRLGNRITYRASIALYVATFLLTPFVGYKKGTEFGDGKIMLWIELGVVLIIKTIASVGGLTSALLLITNSAPNHSVLGTLNGLAQTLSAAGRAAGPFISGAVFSAATRVQPKGEALAFGLFGGIAFLGFLLAFGIRNPDLEGEHPEWLSDSEDEDEEEADGDGRGEEDEEEDEDGEEDRPLLGR